MDNVDAAKECVFRAVEVMMEKGCAMGRDRKREREGCTTLVCPRV